MSWARGEIHGRAVGYAIEAKCDWPGCKETIDRGLGYRCGGLSGVSLDEGLGCGGYFCSAHRQGYRRLTCATTRGNDYFAAVCNDCAKPPSKRRGPPTEFAP